MVVVVAGSRPVLPGVPLDRLPVYRLDPSNLVPLCKHVLEAGVTSTADHDRRGTTGQRARLRNVFTGVEVERDPIDALIVSPSRRQPEDALWHALRDTIEAHLVGEASAARPTDTVILEAAVLARRL